jgi:hypothetical protein
MNKSSVLSAIAALNILTACSKEIPLEKRVVLHPNKAIWKIWHVQKTPQGDTLIQGAFKEFYWDGAPSISTEYTDGEKDGTCQAWYENGATKWTKEYEHGRRIATWRLFSKDGRTMMELGFEAGLMEGPMKIWDKNDTSVVRVAKYSKGKCQDGDCTALDSLTSASADKAHVDLIQDFLE